MPRKTSIYLDTSIPNALFQGPPERTNATAKFFRTVPPAHDAFVSEFVLSEIEATPDPVRRRDLLASVETFVVLPVSPEAERLAAEYLKYLKIPEADALHIAIATIEGIDYLVTWNMEHMAKEKTRRIVDNQNFLTGSHRIFIVTPGDLLEE